MNVNSFSADDFDGRTRLFPLPNLVMFPYALQALHIFEPRYVAMFRDALESDRLFALGLLAEGWEPDYDGRPPVHPMVCLCQIVTHQRREHSLYDTVVFGVSRAKIVEELPPQQAFREIQVELLPDVITTTDKDRGTLENQLFRAVDELMPGNAAMIRQLRDQSAPDATLSILTDLLAYSLPFSCDQKQALLVENCVIRRAKSIIAQLSRMAHDSADQNFPPRFSDN